MDFPDFLDMPWRGDLSLIAAPSNRLPEWCWLLHPLMVTVNSRLGWFVLALVFLDELLLMAALAVWGADAGGWWLGVLAVTAGVLVWFLFASPKARYGGPVVRPPAKVLVVAAAVGGLFASGHPGWAVALLVFSVVVNAVALHPDIKDLATSATTATAGRGGTKSRDPVTGRRTSHGVS